MKYFSRIKINVDYVLYFLVIPYNYNVIYTDNFLFSYFNKKEKVMRPFGLV